MPIELVARPHNMFERPSPATVRSTKSIILSLAIHGGLVIALFAMRYSVQWGLKPRRNFRVTLLAPAAVPLPKYTPVRAPSKTPVVQAAAKFIAPKPQKLTPPLLQPPIEQPSLKTPAPVLPVVAEAAPQPPTPPRPVVQTDVFSNAPAAKPAATPLREVQTGGFTNASAGSAQAGTARQTVAAGFG